MGEPINPMKQACDDVMALWQNKITKEEFIKSYKAHAGKYREYADMVEDFMKSGITDRHFIDVTAPKCDKSTHELIDIFSEQLRYGATQKLIDAVYDVAYTRTPNNERGGDGKPMSYDRKYNIGPAAEYALRALMNTCDSPKDVDYVHMAWSYPRQLADSKTSNADIKESISRDFESCKNTNKTIREQQKMRGS